MKKTIMATLLIIFCSFNANAFFFDTRAADERIKIYEAYMADIEAFRERAIRINLEMQYAHEGGWGKDIAADGFVNSLIDDNAALQTILDRYIDLLKLEIEKQKVSVLKEQ